MLPVPANIFFFSIYLLISTSPPTPTSFCFELRDLGLFFPGKDWIPILKSSADTARRSRTSKLAMEKRTQHSEAKAKQRAQAVRAQAVRAHSERQREDR